MNKLLTGKLALVTGAASGIGRATCQVLSREGATVICADRNEEAAQDTIKSLSGSDHKSIKIEVEKLPVIRSALDTLLKHYSRPPTIIINCAGITRDGFMLKLSEEDFDAVLQVNLKGTFLITQTFANAIIANKINEGSIINFSSVVAKHGNIGQANYSASKAGVELFTKTTAKELGKFGIRCNAILPGFTKSPMTDTIPEKVKEMFIKTIPAGRFADASEIAEVAAFLASDKSSYINGASIEVTGGL